MIIAIDGPSGSGKSTLGRMLARELNLLYIDTGSMYRAVALATIEARIDPADAEAVVTVAEIAEIDLEGNPDSLKVRLNDRDVTEEIRSETVTELSSVVSSIPGVRRAMVVRQRELGERGAVLNGRDIGTVVFPDADLKVFLIADPWERARRRLTQRHGRAPTDAEIAEETERLVQRDAKDATQTVQAKDAILIDTTYLTQAEQVERIASLAEIFRSDAPGSASAPEG